MYDCGCSAVILEENQKLREKLVLAENRIQKLESMVRLVQKEIEEYFLNKSATRSSRE